MEYRKTSNTRRALVGNKIVDHSDIIGASPVDVSNEYMATVAWAKRLGHRKPQDNTKKAQLTKNRFGYNQSSHLISGTDSIIYIS